jgi:light-regulated signal transduction histidine kinase (bacteriophytochrome)
VVDYYGTHSALTLTHEGLSAEGWYSDLGGKDRYIIFEAAPIYNTKGQLIAAIETLQDITERKRAEETLALQTQELARSNTDLERFAYVASHDLQEPLRMVSSYVQLIAKRYEGKLDPDADDFIAFTLDGIDWMQSLINALLTYSRVGTQAGKFQMTDFNQVLARVMKNLQIAVQEHNADVTYEKLPVTMADTSQMEQLFQNLVNNAIKFHGEKPPRIEISAEKKENHWLFCVRDHGIGIDPQYSERIFEIFQRLHSRQEYAGTGIGLAVCKRIIERHGGRIWVESQLGAGAAFYFTLPF